MTSNRPRCFEDILSRLPGARQSGDPWTASHAQEIKSPQAGKGQGAGKGEQK